MKYSPSISRRRRILDPARCTVTLLVVLACLLCGQVQAQFSPPGCIATSPCTVLSLHSNGNVFVGGSLQTIGGATVGGTLGVTGNAAVGSLNVTGNSVLAGGTLSGTYAGNPTFSGLTTLSGGTFNGTYAGAHTLSGAVTLSAAGTGLSVTNNETIGGTLGVTGLATLVNATVNGVMNVTAATGYELAGTTLANSIAGSSNGQISLFGIGAGVGINTSAIEATCLGTFTCGALGAGMTGAENSLMGWHNGGLITTGSFVTCFGGALLFETTGHNLTCAGADSMRDTVGLTFSVAFGDFTVRDASVATPPSAISAFGSGAVQGNAAMAGSFLTGLGNSALHCAFCTTANHIVATGFNTALAATTAQNDALYGDSSGVALTTGVNDAGFGTLSLFNLTSGAGDTGAGFGACFSLTTVSGTTCVGAQSGSLVNGPQTTIVGSSAMSGVAGTQTNDAIFGYQTALNASGSNLLILGALVGSTTLAATNDVILIGNSAACDVPTAGTADYMAICGTGGPIITATGLSVSTPGVAIPGSLAVTGVLALSAQPKFASSSSGAGAQTFTNSPCTGLASERWIPVSITGQSGTWFVPACQ